MEKVFMKLHQAIEEITGLKKSKVSYTDIAQALVMGAQAAREVTVIVCSTEDNYSIC